MFFKLLFLLIIFLNLGIPLNDKFDLIFIFIGILALFSVKKDYLKKLLEKKFIVFSIFILTMINIFIPKFFYHEAHQVFLNFKDINIINQLLPDNIIYELKNDFNEKFNQVKFEGAAEKKSSFLKNKKFIDKSFAYSVDSIFQDTHFSRKTSKINFNSREDLRIGTINSLRYNFRYDKEFRRDMPYYVLFELNKISQNSKICSKGELYYYFSKNKITLKDIKKSSFVKVNKNECLNFNKNNDFLYLIGYSINKNANLELKINENYTIIFLKFFLFIILLIFYKYLFNKNSISNLIIYFISITSTVLLTFIRDPSLIFGLRYYRGGADGLLHYSFGRDIIENINSGNLLLALRGGEDIYYYMPGMRYFSALNNIMFGETSYGYLVICSLIPIIIYKIFEKIINKKIALILLISFIFFPIFENMGFGHFNYIWQYARHHAESVAIMLILFSFFVLLSFYQNTKYDNKSIYFLGFILSLAVFLRPNFFPTSIIFILFAFYLFIKFKKYELFLFNSFGYLFIFLCLMHNYLFGNSYNFFTDSSVNFYLNLGSFLNGIFSFVVLDFMNENLIILKNQLFEWNPLYNTHRIIILFFISYIIIIKKHLYIYYIVYLTIISQHAVLILTHPSSRYAYLAWLLTFILFIKFAHQLINKKNEF